MKNSPDRRRASVASIASVVLVGHSQGVRPLFVRPSRRSPSGWSLVLSATGYLSHATAFAARFGGCLRRRYGVGPRGSWFISVAVSGVEGVPEVAVERVAGVPVVRSQRL